MRAFLVPVIAAFMLTGSIVSYGEQQDTRINLKQLVQNQITQIRARGMRQETLSDSSKTSSKEKTSSEEKISSEEKTSSEEKVSFKNTSSKTDDGIFLKIFVLVDLSLLAALFIYWRRRKLKISTAEKAKFKKNITKLRSEGRFHRRAKSESDEVRKRLQLDPVCETSDEAMLRHHARKLSVSEGELLLASRIRSLEKAHE